MYIVSRAGNVHFILDNIRQKIRFQIGPYLKDLYAMGFLKSSPDSFIEQVNLSVNVGVAGLCPITSITKKLVRQNTNITTFSLEDSRNYYFNTIVPAKCIDFRGMMECIIDALILNGVFPHDVLLGSLLQNTNLAYIESLHAPVDKAAYLVEKSKANRFMYETVRGGKISGTHAYYTLDSAATGRYALQNDTEEYVVSYSDGRQDSELIPLSGFRNHGFNPSLSELGVQHNTVNIMSAVHILVSRYLELYQTNISLIMGTDPEYTELYQLYSYYKPAIQQARAILSLNFQSHNEKNGENEKGFVYTIPYTINMETLFEYYARTELKKALKGSEYRVEQYSKKLYLQKDIDNVDDAEKGIHLMSFCIPDIIIYKEDKPVVVIDAKYKLSGRPDRSDSHQLLSYVLLTGADRCGFVLPGEKTEVKEMVSTGDNYLPLAPRILRYYELLLGSKSDSSELQKVLQ